MRRTCADKGDWVDQDEVLVVLETDKVSVDVRAPAPGFLEEQIPNKGDTVAVGAPLAKLRAGTKPAGAAAAAKPAAPAAAAPAPAPAPAPAAAKAAAPAPAAAPKAAAAPAAAPPAPKPAPSGAPGEAGVTHISGSRTETHVKMNRMRLRIAQRCVRMRIFWCSCGWLLLWLPCSKDVDNGTGTHLTAPLPYYFCGGALCLQPQGEPEHDGDADDVSGVRHELRV
jgi:pyruvate/2-oxoglutarate dehydrogenase complex dihydrolipoamide acyltransferase (E2) component